MSTFILYLNKSRKTNKQPKHMFSNNGLLNPCKMISLPAEKEPKT